MRITTLVPLVSLIGILSWIGWSNSNSTLSYLSTSPLHQPSPTSEVPQLNNSTFSFSSFTSPLSHFTTSALQLACDRRSDSLELVKFYNATGGPNWKNKWDFNKPMDSWFGIRLNLNGCVICIDLDGIDNCKIDPGISGNNLNGILLDINFNALEKLILNNGRLSGEIPDFNFLPSINELSLTQNAFFGKLPTMKKCINLKYLDFSWNQIRDTIVNFNLPNLEYLDLAINKIFGVIPNFSHLPKLKLLLIRGNTLMGEIPNFSKMPDLEYLALGNELTGNLPELNYVNKLKFINFNGNSLTGKIPDYNHLKELEELYLSSNKLSGVVISPTNEKLFRYDIRSNDLNGNLPKVDKLVKLKYFTADQNEFTGIIPDFSSNVLLEQLDLSYNNLSGNIQNFKTIKLLNYLYLAGNKFTYGNIINNLKELDNELGGKCKIRNCGAIYLTYAPQQPIYTDTTIIIPANTSYTLDLKIDDTVSTSTYTWYKNGIQFRQPIKGSNKLPFIPFTSNDAGTYTVKVTNPHAPQLTLESFPIRLVASPSLVCDRRSDSLELVKFYNATGGQNWWKKWDLKNPMDTWWGISFNNDGCVISIILSDTLRKAGGSTGNNLTGNLININIPTLETLDLSKNRISGEIPLFEKLISLKNLKLNSNEFEQSISDFLTPNLEFLDLSSNRLIGNIPNFTNLPLLRDLFLIGNSLTGGIPDFDNLPLIRSIHLVDNKLTGNIPEFKNNIELQQLYFNNNKLSGSIPNFNLPKLTVLSIPGNQLAGLIPNFDKLLLLSELNLRENKITGEIPKFDNLPNLGGLVLANNQLSGNIPSFSRNRLVELDLSNNNLKGTILDITSFNPNLSRYWLFHNKFTFSDIILNLKKIKRVTDTINTAKGLYDSLIYSPQQPIYSDTTILIPSNTPYSIDLKIDDTVTTSTYTWYKNGIQFRQPIKGSNKLPFNPFTSSDAGTFTVKITNPHAPQLTLESFPIRLVAIPNLVCDRRFDSLELVKFYNATGGSNWTKKWDFKKPLDSLFGITLTNTGCIKTIDLNGNNLFGTVINFNLQALERLSMNSNKLFDTIANFDHLPSLTTLDLSNNNTLKGSIPNFNKLPLLRYLDLSLNPFTGRVPELENCPLLEYIRFNNCLLTGTIPSFNVHTNLKFIGLAANSLVGNLPSFTNNLKLQSIILNQNMLTGTIPLYPHMPDVKELFLADNKLTGSLQDFNFPKLIILSAHNNLLSGSIPPLKKCPTIQNFEIHNNQFSGVVPDLNHLTQLTTLTLSNNKLSGSMPNTFKFSLLKELWLANNNFKSIIPDYTINNTQLHFGTYENNKLTFEDIIQNRAKDSILIFNNPGQKSFSYAPQQKIFVDTTITVTTTNYTLDLKIDDTVTTSTYTWYKNNVLHKTTKGNKLIFEPFTSNDAGTYTVKITNPYAPQLTLESWPIRLVTTAKIIVKIIETPANICFNSSPPILKATAVIADPSDTNRIIRTWSGNGVINGQFYPSVAGIGNHLIKYSITQSGNIYADSVYITVNKPKAAISIDRLPSCPATLDARLSPDFQILNGIGPLLFEWIGKGTKIGNAYVNVGEGQYKLVVTDANSCTDTTTVNLKSLFQFNYNGIKDEFTAKYNTSIPFDVIQNDINPGNLALNITVDQPSNGKLIFSQSTGKGTYTPNLKFSGKEIVQYNVCSAVCPESCDTSTITFNVDAPCADKTNLKIPNIIFPNESGINRYFHVEAIEKCPDAFGPKPSSLKVFNRWGDLVYSSSEYKNDWDGENNKGQPLPDGTYYYLLDMGSQGGPVKGWVVIMR